MVGRGVITAIVVLAGLAGCANEAQLTDPRALALVRMPGPQHYAERAVARELVGRCAAFTYDQQLAETMSRIRVKSGLETEIQVRGAAELESDVKRRSLAAKYGGSWGGLDACAVLRGETASGTPLSSIVRQRG